MAALSLGGVGSEGGCYVQKNRFGPGNRPHSGHDAAQRQAEGGRLRAVESERCETRYDERNESRIESYQVSYQYHGRTYQTTLPRDPGQQLRVRVAVTPAE